MRLDLELPGYGVHADPYPGNSWLISETPKW